MPPTSTKEFFDKIKPWSKRKHRLLKKYLTPFGAKVGKTTTSREIFCIDGFAGAGIYDDGNEGSPMLTARFADACANWQDPLYLKLINVEPDKDNEGIFESLINSTQDWEKRGVVRNIRSDFFSALPEILETIKAQPALFFIDPLRPSQVFFSHLLPIFSRPQRISELIINFDSDGLFRIAKAATSPKTNAKVAEANVRLVNEIVGSSRWLDRIQDQRIPTEEGEAVLLEEYLANIRRFGYEVVAYPVRESLHERAQYHFVYCTRHRDGILLMNDFIREEEDLLYDEHIDRDLPLFSKEEGLSNAIARRRESLSGMLESYMADHQFVTRGQIKEDILVDNFGRFHSKDVAAVVKSFLDAGKLKSETGHSRINDGHRLQFSPQESDGA